jgi:hypothetical protein
MYPLFHEQMARQRVEELQREAAAIQRINSANSNLDNTTGNHSFTRILWYLLFGLHIPTSSQKQEYTPDKLQARLNATMRGVGLVALGLGLLIGGYLNSRFGLVPIVLLSSIILVAVSFPILLRSVSVLSKHKQVPSHH